MTSLITAKYDKTASRNQILDPNSTPGPPVSFAYNAAGNNIAGLISPIDGSVITQLNAVLDDSNTRYIRRMKGRILSGSGRGSLLHVGDSTTVGTGSGTGALGLVGGFLKSYPTQLAAALTARGMRASNKTFTGDQAVTSQVTYPQYDPRLAPAPGVGWSLGSLNSFGGNAAYFQGGGVGTFSLTEVCTNFTVYFARGFSAGTCTVTVDGGASLGTISAVGGPDVIGVTFSAGALGSHVIQINAANNGNFVVPLIVCWDATNTGIDIIQAGAFGVASSFFATASNVWNALNVIGYVAPDATFIQLGINDIVGGITPTALGQNLFAIATKAKLSGDAYIMDMLPNLTQPYSVQAPYIAAAVDAANRAGALFLSINNRLANSYSISNGMGYYYDTTHLTSVGYGMEADWLASLIMAM